MSYTKELLLAVATVFVTTGTAQIVENVWVGSALLLMGVVVFVGRGFYKKFLETKNGGE